MKNIIKKVKGFTLTELAIVIAVIAILIAVLVPTFISLINSANESNDMVLVSNLNTSLSIAGEPDKVTVENKDSDEVSVYNVTTAITSVRGDGYDVSKLTPTSDNGDIVYNATTNKFVYYADDFTELAYGDVNSGDVLVVVDADLNRVGLAENELSGNTIQYCVYNEGAVSISTSAEISIWVYTESGTSTIEATKSVIYRYGTGEKDEASVDSSSYHLYGKLDQIVLKQGHLDIKDENSVKDVILSVSTTDNQPYVTGSVVENLVIDTTSGTTYTKEDDNKVTATNTIKKDENLSGIEGYGTSTSPYVVESEADLVTIATYSDVSKLTLSVNNGDETYTTATATITTVTEITLEGTFPESYYTTISSSAGLSVDVGEQMRKYVSDDGKANYVDLPVALENSALRIGSVYYQSITALGTTWGSLTEDQTITLLSSFSLSDIITITSNTDVTLDLNGCTLTVTGSSGNAFTLSTGSALTITDSSSDESGKLVNKWNGTYLVKVGTQGSVLTLEGGTIEQKTYNKVAINLTNGGIFNMTGGTMYCTKGGTSSVPGIINCASAESSVNISGGTINSTGSYASAVYATSGSTVNISGGTIKCTGNDTSIKLSGSSSSKVISLNISGCEKISGKKYAVYCLQYANVVVTGGSSIGDIYFNAATCSASVDKTVSVAVAKKTGVTLNKIETDEAYGYTCSISDGDAYIIRNGETIYFTDVQSAVTGAQVTVDESTGEKVGETVYLKADYTGYVQTNKTVTIDLNGWSITYGTGSSHNIILANSGADITIKNTTGRDTSGTSGGIISYTNSNGSYFAVLVRHGATVTIGENVTVTSVGSSTVFIGTSDNTSSNVATLNVYGAIINTGSGYAISGNGTDRVGGTVINIYEGAEVTSENGAAIYHPQYGTVNVSGGTVTGKYVGIQMCGGSLYITGGTFKTTATSDEVNGSSANPANKTGDGVIFDGAAVSIVNRSGYVGITEVSITGGTFTSESGEDAIQVYSYEGNNEKVEWTDVDSYVAISGVTY